MSKHGVERLLHAMNRNSELAHNFAVDRESVLAATPDLTADERRMLENGDVLALYRYGLHPLLLIQGSRFFGLDQPTFLERLTPAKGERTS